MTATATAAPRQTLYRVSEVFGPVIQGEGALIGQPTLFIRFGGCDSRCVWCDSPHAVLPKYRETWSRRTPAALLDELNILAHPPYWVTLSGGNPALQPCGPLIRIGRARGYRFACETQGTAWPDWFSDLDHLVLSPKPPSSGEQADLALLARHLAGGPAPSLGARCSLKVVVLDAPDLDFAESVREIASYYGVPFFVQPCNLDPDPTRDADQVLAWTMTAYRALAEAVITRGWDDCRVLPQLHVFLFGNRRGV